MTDSNAIQAMRAGMDICPDEHKGHVALKAVWLAGFMRGYRFKQEEQADELA
ncbi:hypothetical protein [Microbacterium sp. JAI119]|uniref:hypothetical protein n=1 Tax=Microbacterium sp. JAI119 TaxID=2723062 RepID=UPI0015C6B626|nr:hypothetical protein [Microbacterium sp. JAI119]NYF29061.1 hypothetical protein [Microbacterium sp. JAI119]